MSAPRATSGVFGAPYAKYAPETGLVVGASGIYYFRLPNHGDTSIAYRPSEISGGITYSTRRQLSSGMDYTLYLAEDKIYVFGGFDYKRIPFDFFGIGNHNGIDPIDHYTPLWRGGDCLVTVNLAQTAEGTGLGAGICTEVRSDQMVSSDSGKVLQTGTVPGSRGGLSAGAGFIVTYDTRDNVFSSHSGTFLDTRLMWYSSGLGGSFNYRRLAIDARAFFPTTATHTLGVQALFTGVAGDEPFYTMAHLGGDINLRGYFEGRFRDHNMALVQTEYRVPVWWRFGLAGFLGIGEVSSTLRGFNVPGLHASGGMGIRFLIDKDERLTARLDYGIGGDTSELYLQINEAF